MSDLAVKIEALLFALGRPLSRQELGKFLGASGDVLEAAIKELQEEGSRRGIALVDDGREIQLRVSGSAAALVESLRRDEYDRELGKAGQEALAAILYRGPLSRSEIDFIRGVNSSQTLRTLTMRGLVRKVQSQKNARVIVYEPTTELLATLGVGEVSDLPDYASVREKLAALEEAYRQKEISHAD